MTTHHTPGPWTVVDHGKGSQWIENDLGAAIAQLPDWLPEVGNPRDANARLMAAAPDLLASLKIFVLNKGCGRPCPYCDAARAAIAKAEGSAE